MKKHYHFRIDLGLIITAMMVFTTAACYNNPEFEGNALIGYSWMLIAFAFIFVGIRNYRNKYSNGQITFGKAFKIGFFITLIAATMYVVVWLVEYYLFVPDFMERYTAHVLQQARADGATEAKLAAKVKEMEMYSSMYKSPFFVVLLTYAEVLPIGLIVSLISALILKRRSGHLSGAMSN